jgi:hypothetical protein
MKRLLILILALLVCKANAFAFNLWEDVQQNTQWTLGENASAGTAYDVVKDQIDVSELAQIASYRFLSAWYGGIQVPQSDNTVKWTDAGKIGLNLNYFLARVCPSSAGSAAADRDRAGLRHADLYQPAPRHPSSSTSIMYSEPANGSDQGPGPDAGTASRHIEIKSILRQPCRLRGF